jgi:hypothetical protein
MQPITSTLITRPITFQRGGLWGNYYWINTYTLDGAVEKRLVDYDNIFLACNEAVSITNFQLLFSDGALKYQVNTNPGFSLSP